MQDEETNSKDVEATLGQLEELAGQADSKSVRRSLARLYRSLVEKIARQVEEERGLKNESS